MYTGLVCKRVHTADGTVQSLQYIEDYSKVSETVDSSVHNTDTDKARQSSLVRVGGEN